MKRTQRNVGCIGLGYAGFPMACLFSKYYPIVGYDISEQRIKQLRQNYDHNGDVSPEEIKALFEGGSLITNNLNELEKCDFYIVCVPTPVDSKMKPDMSYLISASASVGKVLKKGDIVVYESTVYPGATEEVCVPVLEEVSGLKFNEDFFVGYSPERINPGDKEHKPENIVKVTSGSTPEVCEIVSDVYESVVGKGNVHPVSSIKVAEACKVIENAQRDINIAFMNEMAQVLGAMDIDTNEVVDAMNTKWNALGFRPGLVGGHCIGIDPYYLCYKAKEKGVETGLMNMARSINNSMPEYIVDNVVEDIKSETGVKLRDARVLIMGVTFKENCPDIRNTKVLDIYKELSRKVPHTVVYDPNADPELVKNYYGIDLLTDISQLEGRKFNAILLSVAHDKFKDFDYKRYLKPHGFIYDVKGFVPESVRKEIKVKRV